MTKTRKLIYLAIFIVLIITIVLCLLKLRFFSPSTSSSAVPTSSITTQIIDWDTASDLIKNCQIKVIFQSRNLQINLRGHDNQIYQTTEPKFNDVVNLAKEVQGPCDIIQTVTE
ncbi:MAG: hypothetical protein PHX34_03170 [Candidatus Shapirobacteria bacterium]|nr:hypothetical protein [Candidatus Shapirobacteria bacterium]